MFCTRGFQFDKEKQKGALLTLLESILYRLSETLNGLSGFCRYLRSSSRLSCLVCSKHGCTTKLLVVPMLLLAVYTVDQPRAKS